jgi:hypothetical protein
MNYYQPSELRDANGGHAGKWHYTVTNDKVTFPAGYCADGCAGHDTPEGAREHFKEYLLDNARFDGKLSNQQRKCEICGVYTERLGQVPSMMVHHSLCDEHCNREGLAQVLHVGDFATS